MIDKNRLSERNFTVIENFFFASIVNPMSVWEKLYKDRETKDGLVRVMQDLKRQVEESKLSQLHSTTSRILSQSKKPSEFYLQQAAERREARLSSYMKSSEPEFRPKILTSSRKLASARPESRQRVFERLYAVKTPNACLPEEFVIGSESSRRNRFENEIPFLERQRMDADMREWKGKLRSEWQQRRCSFTPRLNTKSEDIAVKKGRDADIVRRLAVDDILERQANQVRLVMDADPQCRFIPEIDSYSDAIASMKRVLVNVPVHEKLYHACRATESKSPRPDIPDAAPQNRRPKSAYKHVRSHYNLRNPNFTQVVIDNARREREELINEVLREKEEKELAECTFQPKVNKYKGDRGDPIPVAGLDKFVASRDQGRRMSEVGRIPSFREYTSSSHDGVLTIPQPFTLSGFSD